MRWAITTIRISEAVMIPQGYEGGTYPDTGPGILVHGMGLG